MFTEEVKASFAAQARRMAEQINHASLAQYLEACRNWAINAGAGQEPEIPVAVTAEVSFQPIWKIELVQTTRPVSPLIPRDFLPTYATDDGAIGGPVGGPIPGVSGRYYATSTANPQAGDVHQSGGATFEYKRPTPFGGYWERR